MQKCISEDVQQARRAKGRDAKVEAEQAEEQAEAESAGAR